MKEIQYWKGWNIKKIWISQDSLSQNWYLTDDYIRETDEGKIYFTSSLPNWEVLLYDYTLELGDTLILGDIEPNCDFEVVAIDSIELLNGEMRKRWKMKGLIDEFAGFHYQIEGIGSSWGFLNYYFNFCYVDIGEWLICYEYNGELLYNDGASDNCFFPVSTNEDFFSKNLKIYPNPTSNILNILLENSENSQPFNLKLFDFTGKEIQSFKSILPNTSFQINAKDLPRGTYLLQIIQNETFTIEKIILN